MAIQEYLIAKFCSWVPEAPVALSRSQRSVTLSWSQPEPFGGLQGLLYSVSTKTKVPPWTTVYSGGKTRTEIDNLAPSFPHKFVLRVILRAEAVPGLTSAFLRHSGSPQNIYEYFGDEYDDTIEDMEIENDVKGEEADFDGKDKTIAANWLTSLPSEETCVTTLTRGTSPACFGMAVRCGYIKQVQQMLAENPLLLETINSANGQTPLIAAVRTGDIHTVSFLLAAGADPEQPSSAGQTALHLALYSSQLATAELLLEKGARIETRDLNGCRAEHYAADSGSATTVAFALDRGGDVAVVDSNNWDPLFRAVCQGAPSELVEVLVRRGSDLSVRDAAGLPLPHAARLLRDRRGRARESVVRCVEPGFPRALAATRFTRLTRKISSMHAAFK